MCVSNLTCVCLVSSGDGVLPSMTGHGCKCGSQPDVGCARGVSCTRLYLWFIIKLTKFVATVELRARHRFQFGSGSFGLCLFVWGFVLGPELGTRKATSKNKPAQRWDTSSFQTFAPKSGLSFGPHCCANQPLIQKRGRT